MPAGDTPGKPADGAAGKNMGRSLAGNGDVQTVPGRIVAFAPARWLFPPWLATAVQGAPKAPCR